MSRADKRLESMRGNPRDWSIADLENVARHFGVSIRKPGGSHVVFTHPNTPTALSVPAKRPIKPYYVKQFVQLIDEVSAVP